LKAPGFNPRTYQVRNLVSKSAFKRNLYCYALEPTVVFGACEEASEEAGLQPCVRPKLYVRFGGVHNNGVKAAFKTAGFRVIANKSSDNYNALWSGALKAEDFKKLNRYQRVNHFPGRVGTLHSRYFAVKHRLMTASMSM
jgi:hypothetical protein